MVFSLRGLAEKVTAAVNALVVAVWSLAGAMQRVAPDAVYSWKLVEWAAIAVLPCTWMLYVLRYTGYKNRLTSRRWGWLVLSPLSSVVLLVTDRYHHLIWSPWTWQLPYLNSSRSLGPGLLWVAANSLLATLLCFLMLARVYARVRGVFRHQVSCLTLATWLPWLGLALDLLGWEFWPGVSALPYMLMFALLAAAWNVARFRFGDIVPVARELVIDGLQDAVLVLDTQHRVVDYNNAALSLFPALQRVGTGQLVPSIWPDLPFQVDRLAKTRQSYQWKRNGSTYDVAISPLLDDRQQAFCWVVVLRDISELMAAQAALQEAHDRLELNVNERTAELMHANAELEREIEQRQRAAAARRASEARYRSLVETSSDIVALY
ncbi:MAG: PAS domain-containing protein, partial [Chloroflexi bacterium]|nr:PAS domain-containing protein [Chloroflexota bacterium]